MDRPHHKITIGRDAARDIPLGDNSVSAYHAELTILEDGRLLLTDCRSTNGTFVIEASGDARRIRQAVVTSADHIRFGAVTLAVSALLETWRAKPAPRPSSSVVQGQRLVRCPCGCIKPEGTRCRECGR